MGKYQKAIAAFLTSGAGMLAMFGIDSEAVSPELIAAASTMLSTLLVYLLPNKPA